MIKINLLPQRRAKKRATAPDPSSKHLLVGALGLVLAGVAVVLLIDLPTRFKIAELDQDNRDLQREIRTKTKQLEGYAELRRAADDADDRYKSIKRLLSVTVVPANVLHELGEILTPNRQPKMVDDVRPAGAAPTRRFAADWDATHVWLSGWTDTGGAFKLEGGAQSESDVTQLAKRLASSIYFADVTPAGGERIVDTQSNTNYYKFTITGKVAY